MRLWRWVLLLIIIAALAAFGWHWVALDPGYVLVRLRGWRVETTAVAAVMLLLLLWFALTVLWNLARWPFGAFTRRHRRVSQQRLGDGLVALVEGRHGAAEQDLNRAARLHSLRGPALLVSAEAALRRGEPTRALEALDQAAQSVPRAARALRARVLRREGRPAEALALLTPEADKGSLTPNAWRELALAALATGNPARARAALAPLQKSGALGLRGFAALETRVLVALIEATPDGAALDALWSQLPKTQRRVPAVIDAYARRAAGFGLTLAAMDELESALRREWSPLLVDAYGILSGAEVEARMRRAEGWLDGRPNDATLLLALGRLCVRLGLWGKARQFLERSLALAPGAAAWEILGDACAGDGDTAKALRSYHNAFAMSRGQLAVEPPTGTPNSGYPDTRSIALEERDEQGMPRLRP
ncbi:MAG: heme biosynthesis HemY N-terminal domain-containing protein [Rhodanobacter sp.]